MAPSPNNPRTRISLQLKAARSASGLSRTELSSQLGRKGIKVSPSTVKAWESTSGALPQAHQLVELKDVLGYASIDQLVGIESVVQPVPKHQGFLLVATEWGSGHGGLSSFNRNLCLALATAGFQIACVVLEATDDEKRDAAKGSVELVVARPVPGPDKQFALTRRPDISFEPGYVIGHGRITGWAARILIEDHYRSAKRLHFIHMAADEIEWLKPGRSNVGVLAEERTETELELGEGAIVFGVGPRLFNRFTTDFDQLGVPVHQFVPGFDSRIERKPGPPPGSPVRILMVGRFDDDQLKGLDIGARAAALAAEDLGLNRAPEVYVRGVGKTDCGSVREELMRVSGGKLNFVVRPYTCDTDRLDRELLAASLVLMPSRSEGFGLVGLESIAAGTPVLISGESGLGELINKTLDRSVAGRVVVPMFHDDEKTIDRWRLAIYAMLSNRPAAFASAQYLQESLSQFSWTRAVKQMVNDLEPPTKDQSRRLA